MTFLTFQSTDIFYSYTVHFARFDIVMEFFVNAIETVACTVCIEINFGFAVTVDTPAHAQFSIAVYFIHFLDIAMTGLTLYITCSCVLRMIEINVVRKVVNLNPFR